MLLEQWIIGDVHTSARHIRTAGRLLLKYKLLYCVAFSFIVHCTFVSVYFYYLLFVLLVQKLIASSCYFVYMSCRTEIKIIFSNYWLIFF